MLTRKFWYWFLIGLVVVLGILFTVRVLSPEDTWVCKDGQWQKHGNPSATQPTNACLK